MEKKLKETIDRLLLFMWKDTQKRKIIIESDEEALGCLIATLAGLGRYMEDIRLSFEIIGIVRMMTIYGFNHVDLNDKYNGTLSGKPYKDVYHLIRILTSNHSVKKKLVVALGTLIAYAEYYGFEDACCKNIDKILVHSECE